MPSKKQRDENVQTLYELTRPPLSRQPVKESPYLYPDLRAADKENMDFSSSDDSPEKNYTYRHSSKILEKNKAPSNQAFMQEVANVTRRKGVGRKQTNRLQDNGVQETSPENRYSENSDLEIETDIPPDPHQRRETSESPELDKHKYSPEARRILKLHQMQSQSLYPSATSSTSYSFFANSGIYIILFCIISLLLVIVFMRFGYLATSYEYNQLNATALVNSLKAKFNGQPPLTFRIIYSALKNVQEAQPKSPAIILLLATNGSETICRDFAVTLIDLLSVPKYTAKISGEDYKEANGNHAKMEIDKTVKKTLQTNQLGSVLIYNLDQIPGQAAIILHKYYDHENAPFKKAVFVMTVNYNKPISDYSNTKVWDKAAYDHLLGLWTDSGVDQVTALLSRLTVSVAVITNQI